MTGEPIIKVIFDYITKGVDKIDNASQKIGGMSQRVNDSQQAMMNASVAMQQMGNMVGGFATESVNAFASFDQAMANVASIVQGTEEEVEQLYDLAAKMGKDMPILGEEAAQGFYELASAGKSANDILQLSEQITKASIATNSDFATTSKLVTAVLDSWQLENSAVTATTDILLNTVKSFKTTLPELAISLTYAATTAANLGVTTQETAAAIGQLRQAGMDASGAGTGLRMVMLKMAVATTKVLPEVSKFKDQVVLLEDGSVDLASTLGNLKERFVGMSQAEVATELMASFGSTTGQTMATLLTSGESISSMEDALNTLTLTTGDAKGSQKAMGSVMTQLTAATVDQGGSFRYLKDAIVKTKEGNLDFDATLIALNKSLSNTEPLERQAILAELFGSRGANAASILQRQATELEGLSIQMTEAGAVQEAYDKQMEGAANQLKILQGRYEDQQRVLGESLLPTQMKIIDAKIKMLELLNKLPGGMGTYAISIGQVAGELGNALMPVLLLANAMKGLKFKILGTAVAWVKEKIAMVANAIWKGIVKVATWAATAAQWLLNAAMYACPYVLAAIAIVALVAGLAYLVYWIYESTDGFKDLSDKLLFLLGPIGAVIYAIKNWDKIKEIIGRVIGWIKDLGKAIGTAFVNKVKDDIERFKNLWDIGTTMRNKGREIIAGLLEGVLNKFGVDKEYMLDKFIEAFNIGRRLYYAGRDTITEWIRGIKDAIRDNIGIIGDAVKSISGFFGGSPPEFGPMKQAMDYGGPSFVQGYLKNAASSLGTGGINSSTSIGWQGDLNFSPSITNYGGGEETDEEILRESLEKSMDIIRREGLR